MNLWRGDVTMLHEAVAALGAGRVEYEARGGLHSFSVVVGSERVAAGVGASLDTAARRCRDAFRGWREVAR